MSNDIVMKRIDTLPHMKMLRPPENHAETKISPFSTINLKP